MSAAENATVHRTPPRPTAQDCERAATLDEQVRPLLKKYKAAESKRNLLLEFNDELLQEMTQLGKQIDTIQQQWVQNL